MLLGKDGAISPEAQVLQEQQAEVQRQAAARENNERKRISSLTNTQLGNELQRVGLRAAKTSGTGLKICNVDFGPVPTNGLDAAYAAVFCAVLARDSGEGPGLRRGNDPYYLIHPKRGKTTRTRKKA